jgi:hypothetical protein
MTEAVRGSGTTRDTHTLDADTGAHPQGPPVTGDRGVTGGPPRGARPRTTEGTEMPRPAAVDTVNQRMRELIRGLRAVPAVTVEQCGAPANAER